MASLIVLRRFLSSLANILKSSIDTVWPEMLILSCIGEGAFRCSLNLSPKFLADSPILSSLHSTLLHLNLYMTPRLLRIGSLSLGVVRRFLMVGPPFRCTSITYFLQVLLKLSLSPWWYGTVICDFWSLLLLGLEFLLSCFFFWGLMSGFSTLPYWGPMLGTCISSRFYITALLLPAIELVQSRWFLPCGTESQSCCIWMVWHDGCPNAGIGLYVLAFCRQWSWACPLHLE